LRCAASPRAAAGLPAGPLATAASSLMSLLLDQPVDVLPGAKPAPPRPRLRVLVGAYAVSPVQGSEPGVGWNVCSRLARYHDVTVLCAPGCPGEDVNRFGREIDEHLRRH